MDHDHSGHDMPMMCAMHMLWNTQIIDTCIVFESWHIKSVASFIVSVIAIVALGIFYEWLRSYQKAVDRKILAQSKGKIRLSASRDGSRERAEVQPGKISVTISPTSKAIRAVLYAATVFISFFLMLVFMTYNAYLILAVVLGAGIGHYIFAELSVDSDAKGMACH